jgi:hypothetical protein
MRRPILVAGFLLVAGCVLGATIFRGQLASAGTQRPHKAARRADKPPTPVVFTDGTGTSTGNTVAVGNTPSVKVDPTGNTVNLGSTDSSNLASANGHLANIDAATGKFSFDGSGRLETVSPQPAVAGVFHALLLGAGSGGDDTESLGSVVDASTITVASTDQVRFVSLYYQGKHVFDLSGPADPAVPGLAQWTLPLAQPVPIDTVILFCASGCNARVNIVGS